MTRILVVNPNSSQACSDGIASALDPFRFEGGPGFDVLTMQSGPPAIYSWRDWHGVVGPICNIVQTTPADAYIVACASDPGIDAIRATTSRPVFGIFRCAVAAAVARAERFGVIALVDASMGRHLAALRSMGLDARLAGEVAMNVEMSRLLDPHAAAPALAQAAATLVAQGAGAIILGCTGMARHRQAIEEQCGVPVIEPCQAAASQALLALV